jgi:NAD(P)-dependent dehydrogenase (short-subunit alcohol dehydrogenase family)
MRVGIISTPSKTGRINLVSRTKKNIIIISASSDIGAAMSERWLEQGWNVWGTHRTVTPALRALEDAGLKSVYCDLASIKSVKAACSELIESCSEWDVLVLAPGTQEPVGNFETLAFDKWRESIQVNFTEQLGIVHALLSTRRTKGVEVEPLVLFFAGGGTNNAVVKYSGYVISKVALIKMCEFLDAEIEDTRFSIVGPGWVKTKIHQATLDAGEKAAGKNFQETQRKLESDELTPMQDVLDCCDWVIDSPRNVVSGRNFSVVYDRWRDERLADLLREYPDMYKLRRAGNHILVKDDVPNWPTGHRDPNAKSDTLIRSTEKQSTDST